MNSFVDEFNFKSDYWILQVKLVITSGDTSPKNPSIVPFAELPATSATLPSMNVLFSLSDISMEYPKLDSTLVTTDLISVKLAWEWQINAASFLDDTVLFSLLSSGTERHRFRISFAAGLRACCLLKIPSGC